MSQTINTILQSFGNVTKSKGSTSIVEAHGRECIFQNIDLILGEIPETMKSRYQDLSGCVVVGFLQHDDPEFIASEIQDNTLQFLNEFMEVCKSIHVATGYDIAWYESSDRRFRLWDGLLNKHFLHKKRDVTIANVLYHVYGME